MDRTSGLLMLLSLLIPKEGGQPGPPGPPGPPGAPPGPPPTPPGPPGGFPPMPPWGVIPPPGVVVPAVVPIPPPHVVPHVIPVRPGPAPVPPAPGTPLTSAQATALAMSGALADHGYKQYDQGLYRAFQASVGMAPDGYPGKNTMTALVRVMQAMGRPVPQVRIYPWKSTGAYDGTNAPTLAEWMGTPQSPAPHVSPAPGQPPAAPVGPPAHVQPYPGPGSWHTNGPYIARVQNALAWLGYNPGPIDGKDGPLTEAAVKQFQAHAGIKQDGQAGAQTAAAIDSALGGGG